MVAGIAQTNQHTGLFVFSARLSTCTMRLLPVDVAGYFRCVISTTGIYNGPVTVCKHAVKSHLTGRAETLQFVPSEIGCCCHNSIFNIMYRGLVGIRKKLPVPPAHLHGLSCCVTRWLGRVLAPVNLSGSLTTTPQASYTGASTQ
jgi:hypothetical protein